MAKATETINVSKELKEKLDGLKPYPSVTYNDLIADMAAEFEAEKPTTTATDGGR